MAETKYVFKQLYPTGEIYAVRYLDDADGTITGACGPLDRRDVRTENLPDFPYDGLLGTWMTAEDVHGVSLNYWLAPLSETQVAAIRAQYEE
jgi:hypothetical protein